MRSIRCVSGKDCSIVRLDQGKSYCRPVEPPPEPPPYCTRSLGVADCWRDPASFPNHPPSLGDGPHTLTPAQEADRTRSWPHSLIRHQRAAAATSASVRRSTSAIAAFIASAIAGGSLLASLASAVSVRCSSTFVAPWR